MGTILFFDDQALQMRYNAERHQGRPTLMPESLYVDPNDQLVNLAWGYPTVVHAKEQGRWLMYYQGWPVDHKAMPTVLPLMAASEDGLRWSPLAPVQEGPADQWLLPHQYLPLHCEDGIFLEGQVYHDEHAPAAERFKALTLYRRSPYTFLAPVFVSADGLHWHRKEGVAWHDGDDAPDYPLGIFYNTGRQSTVITGRPAHCDRRIALRETKDWRTFTAPELLLQPDCHDRAVSDLYGMPATAYHGYYIGFLEIYQPVPYTEYRGEKPGSLPAHKFLDGSVSCQLAYSQTGWVFQRFMRQPFIPQESPAAPDFACVYPCCLHERAEDLLLYASMSRLEHGRIPKGTGAIGAYSLRKDGFAFLRARDGVARLRTKPLHMLGDGLALNVCAIDGACRMQLCATDGTVLEGASFDDCVPITGDALRAQVQFAGTSIQALLAEHPALVLDIELRHADLYAIHGDFEVFTPYQAARLTR